MTGGTDSSGSDPFVHARFLQLSSVAAISIEMRPTNSIEQYRGLEHNNKRNSFSVRTKQSAEMVH